MNPEGDPAPEAQVLTAEVAPLATREAEEPALEAEEELPSQAVPSPDTPVPMPMVLLAVPMPPLPQADSPQVPQGNPVTLEATQPQAPAPSTPLSDPIAQPISADPEGLPSKGSTPSGLETQIPGPKSTPITPPGPDPSAPPPPVPPSPVPSFEEAARVAPKPPLEAHEASEVQPSHPQAQALPAAPAKVVPEPSPGEAQRPEEGIRESVHPSPSPEREPRIGRSPSRLIIEAKAQPEFPIESSAQLITTSTISPESASSAFTLQAETHPLIREFLAQPRVEPERLTLPTPKTAPLAQTKETRALAQAADGLPPAEASVSQTGAREEAPARIAGFDSETRLASAPHSPSQGSGTTVASATATFTAPLPNTLHAPSTLVQTPAPVATPPHPAMAQVEGSIRWLLNRDRPGAELQLHPEALGRVTIQLRVEGGEVHARIWATEPATVPLLQEHKGHLELSLREQGLQLGSFDLHQGQRGGQNPMEQAPWQGRLSHRPLLTGLDSRQETPQGFPVLSTHRGLVEVFA